MTSRGGALPDQEPNLRRFLVSPQHPTCWMRRGSGSGVNIECDLQVKSWIIGIIDGYWIIDIGDGMSIKTSPMT